MAKYLDETGLSKAFELIKNWATATFLGDVTYDPTSRKIQKTKNGTTSDVVTIPSGVSPYDSNPSMDGTADPGSSGLFARGDHVHPTDTSRAANADFTGATGSAAGAHGLVPAPASGETTKLLWSDGNWKTIEPDLTTNDGNLYLKLYKRNSGTGGEGRTQVSSDDIPLSYLWPSVASSRAAGLMSSTDKNNLDTLVAAGPEANVQSDWNQSDTTADDYIKNKPTIPSGKGVYYGTCNTSENVSDKVVVCNDFTTLETGAVIFVFFDDNHYENQSHVTLNVNNTGAKGLSGFNTGYAYWGPNQILSFTYNGSTWQVNDAAYIDTQDTTSAISSADKMYLVGAKIMGPAGRNTYANTKVYATDGAFVCDTINTGNGAYEINAAAAKAIGSVANGNTGLVTGDAVYDAIQDALSDVAGALVYKGTAASASAISGTSYKKGWYWIASDTFALTSSINVEPGDMIIAKQDKTSTFANDIDVVQTNIETLTTAEVTALWNAA